LPNIATQQKKMRKKRRYNFK